MTDITNSGDIGGAAIPVGIGVALVVGAAAVAFGRRRSPVQPPRDLEGVTVCLTGGNVGIGRAVAENLSQRGAKLIIGCRNVEQATSGICQSISARNGGQCDVFALDLASSASVESFSESVVNQTSRTGLQLLINNAGAMLSEEHQQTANGWDASMMVNHLGWVQLTKNLMPVLEQTASSSSTTVSTGVRVVNVGSKLEKTAVLPEQQDDPACWDAWMQSSPTPYNSFQAYAKGKFAMTAMTFLWADRLQSQDNGIKMILVSPGMVNTSLSRFMPLWKRVLSWPFRSLLKTPEQGAESVIYAAASPDAVSGRYYSDCVDIRDSDKCSESSKDPAIGEHIWDATMRALEKLKKSSSSDQQPTN